MSENSVTEISSKEQFDKVLQDHEYVVVDFYATWCGPCKAMAPKVASYAQKYPEMGFLKVDVDQMPSLASEYEITGMPTFLFIKGGKVTDKLVGANAQALETKIEALRSQ